MVELDPHEMLDVRDRQKVDLARYGRQSLLQWDHIPINTIRRYHRLLGELIDKEHPMQHGIEEA